MGAVAIENTRFKQNYGHYLLDSAVAAILVHLLIFYFTPPFEIEPYEYVETKPQCILIEDKPDIVLEPEEVGLPPIPIVPGSGEEVDEEIDFKPTMDHWASISSRGIVNSKASVAPVVFSVPPQIVRYVRPVYPELAISAGIEGEVVLKVIVGKNGRVLDVSIVRSNVTPSMERAAIEAVKKFIFRPAMQGGIPLQVSVEVPVRFKLQ